MLKYDIDGVPAPGPATQGMLVGNHGRIANHKPQATNHEPQALTRREWLRRAGAAVCALGVSGVALASEALRIVRSSRMSRDFADGVELGLEEIAKTARLLQRDVEIGTSATAPADTVLLSGSLAAVAIGTSAQAHVLRVVPSREVRNAMLQRWLKSGVDRSGAGQLVAWSPGLHRYGATQLNQRFETKFERGMTEPAWAGWISAKIAGEALLRHAEPALEVRSLHVDGHKGRPLFFDRSGMLVQPMFIIESVGAEWRVHEVAPEETA